VIFRRLLFILAGATALAVSAGVFVIALAYGEFALAKPYVGSAGASGVVAGSAALFIGILAIRNPTYLGAVIRAFIEGREPPRRGGR
jgi:hypothetical protein